MLIPQVKPSTDENIGRPPPRKLTRFSFPNRTRSDTRDRHKFHNKMEMPARIAKSEIITISGGFIQPSLTVSKTRWIALVRMFIIVIFLSRSRVPWLCLP